MINSRNLVRDILIVVVICLIVGALVFPMVFTAGGGYSLKAACMSHVKQLALGTVMYADDADEKAPLHEVWMDALWPYVKNVGIFHCSQVKPADAYGYAFNAGVTSLPGNDPYASTTPLIYDSLSLGRNASDPVGSLPAPGRHKGFNNIAYADGRARSIELAGR